MTLSIESIDSFEKDCIIEEIASLVFAGFKSKFTKMLYKETEAHDIIYAFCHYIYTEKGENLLIAIQDELVCGCIFLTSKGDSHPKLYQALRKFLSFPQCLKLIFLLSLLSHKPVQNERYIDFITVSPNFRGQGIGKILISHYLETFHNEQITLYVAKNNNGAYKLYKTLGFQVIQKENSTLMGVLTGIKEWRKMEWIQ
ncbi:GNAT family N-acetyltransferase [Listeria monocytogenes]|nr:N-acetyltransferase [Listeria monocytogenes]EAG3088977.1 N-acetyltransferase [Listeria monocytogenes]EAG3193876.1 N-acetyltransferase [Listeria monocytogenes]EJQ2927222.1 GNAT family N-acetyltransferase [Listeria monocytogenes]EJQ7597142.1 GNAT family N-acetyltransferase [Listeria monocytogenes]